MTITDSDRLAYEAPELVLLDGRRLPLHYGYGGLRLVSKQFGGVKKLFEILEDTMGPEFYDAVFLGLLFGLWKQRITEEFLEENIDSSDLTTHAKLLTEALMLSFPKEAREAQKEASAPSANEPTTQSNGTSVTTSQPLSVDEPIDSSGE